MSVTDMVLDLKAKEHYCTEIDRKLREIADLKLLIDKYYKNITSDGVLEGTIEGDLLIDEIDDILTSIENMKTECEATKSRINAR